MPKRKKTEENQKESQTSNEEEEGEDNKSKKHNLRSSKDSKNSKQKQTTLKFAPKSTASATNSTASSSSSANDVPVNSTESENTTASTSQTTIPSTPSASRDSTAPIILDESDGDQEEEQPAKKKRKTKKKNIVQEDSEEDSKKSKKRTNSTKKKKSKDDDFIVDDDNSEEEDVKLEQSDQEEKEKPKPSTRKKKSSTKQFTSSSSTTTSSSQTTPTTRLIPVHNLPSPETFYTIPSSPTTTTPSSSPLTITILQENQQQQQQYSIPHLQSTSIPCKQQNAQFHIANVGGNAFQAMDWFYHPTLKTTFMAIGTKPFLSKDTPLHSIRKDNFIGWNTSFLKQEKEEHFLIQIWNCNLETNSFFLEYQIQHEFSNCFVWNIKWVSQVQMNENYLGMVSVIFSNGKLALYAIPNKSTFVSPYSLIQLQCFFSTTIPLLCSHNDKFSSTTTVTSNNEYKYKLVQVEEEEEEEQTEEQTEDSKLQTPFAFSDCLVWYTMQWSPTNEYLVTGAMDGSIQLFKFNTNHLQCNAQCLELIIHSKGHYHPIRNCAIRQLSWYNSHIFASVSQDGSVKLWDCQMELFYGNHCLLHRLVGRYCLSDVCFPYNSNAMFVSSHEGMIKQFQIKEDGFTQIVNTNSSTKEVLPFLHDSIWSMSINVNQSLLLYGTSNGCVGYHTLSKNGLATSNRNKSVKSIVRQFIRISEELHIASELFGSNMETNQKHTKELTHDSFISKVLFHPMQNEWCAVVHSHMILFFRYATS